MLNRGLRLLFIALYCGLALTGFLPWLWAITAAGLCLLGVGMDTMKESNPDYLMGQELACGAEILAAAIVLGTMHFAESFGFLASLPIATRWPTVREKLDRIGMTAGSFILLAAWAESKGTFPSPEAFFQAAGVIVSVSLISHFSHFFTEKRLQGKKSQIQEFDLLEIPSRAMESQSQDELEKLIVLRERYRQLRDSYNELNRKAEFDHLKSRLFDWRLDPDRTMKRLSSDLREMLKVSAVSLFIVPEARNGMIHAGTSGDAPQPDFTLDIPIYAAPVLIREKAEKAVRSLIDPTKSSVANTLLIDRGRVLGMAAIYDSSQALLDESKGALEAIAPFLARLMLDSIEQQTAQRRTAQAELIADLAKRSSNESGLDAATSILSDLIDALGFDGCQILDLTGESAKIMAGVGEEPLNGFEYQNIEHIKGWMKSGEEMVIFDTRNDSRFDRKVAMRGSIGMVVIMPMKSSGDLVGAIVAYTKQAHGISAPALGALREIIPTAVRRIFGGFSTSKAGLVDSDTFWESSKGPGSFVEIDLGHDATGSRAQDLRKSRRKILAAALSRLPQGGLLSRRESGTLIAFLPGVDEIRAAKWSRSIEPFADRTFQMTVAPLVLHSQNYQVLDKMSA